MKTITCYLDFISPYAYLAFEALPNSLMGVSHRMVYKPVLFAGMLKHHGQLGPAEIAGKREWTYRQVVWQAKQLGVPLDMPASHPFNPLALLRLAVACSAEGEPNRYVCETIFKHVWQGGALADDAERVVQGALGLGQHGHLRFDVQVVVGELGFLDGRHVILTDCRVDSSGNCANYAISSSSAGSQSATS